MQALNAETLIIGKIFHLREVLFLLGRHLPDSPVKLFPGHELRQTEQRRPAEVFLSGTGLLPQPFQRGHHKVKIALHPIAALFAHLDGVEETVQQLNGRLVLACRVVGVALPPHCGKGHGWHGDKLRLTRWLVECLIFFLIIKRHRR